MTASTRAGVGALRVTFSGRGRLAVRAATEGCADAHSPQHLAQPDRREGACNLKSRAGYLRGSAERGTIVRRHASLQPTSPPRCHPSPLSAFLVCCDGNAKTLWLLQAGGSHADA